MSILPPLSDSHAALPAARSLKGLWVGGGAEPDPDCPPIEGQDPLLAQCKGPEPLSSGLVPTLAQD